MKNLLLHCRELVTDDIIGRLLTPLACAVALLTKSVPTHRPVPDVLVSSETISVSTGCRLSSGPTVVQSSGGLWSTD